MSASLTTSAAVLGNTVRDLPKGVTMLVHAEHFATIDEARARERQLKNWRRQWKLDLIESSNPDWNDLFGQLNG